MDDKGAEKGHIQEAGIKQRHGTHLVYDVREDEDCLRPSGNPETRVGGILLDTILHHGSDGLSDGYEEMRQDAAERTYNKSNQREEDR